MCSLSACFWWLCLWVFATRFIGNWTLPQTTSWRIWSVHVSSNKTRKWWFPISKLLLEYLSDLEKSTTTKNGIDIRIFLVYENQIETYVSISHSLSNVLFSNQNSSPFSELLCIYVCIMVSDPSFVISRNMQHSYRPARNYCKREEAQIPFV